MTVTVLTWVALAICIAASIYTVVLNIRMWK
jgi:hypothetical protein